MEKSRLDANPENEGVVFQSVTERPKHMFQWSLGTAGCSCGQWKLWNATLESAKRSHAFHRGNLPDSPSENDDEPEDYKKGTEPHD
jgi:hypothetical protein